MMTAASMRARCQAAIDALGDPASYDTPRHFADAAMEAMCSGIIDEIQQNAVVTAAVSVASVTAVAPGIGVSGPGTGTATGTVA